MKKLKIILALLVIFMMVGCEEKQTINYEKSKSATNYVEIKTSQGNILVELYETVAPITVKNFKKLVQEGFYNGSSFHRIVKDFVIQGGINEEKEADTIKGEFKNNGVTNELKHERGVISMARISGENDSANSQFFIMHQDNFSLDGDYAGFGKVIDGMDTVDKLASVMVDGESPIVRQEIKSISFIKILDEK